MRWKRAAFDAESKTITLELVSKLVGQMSFDEETAKRVVTVAMTNCYATDVFTADGSAYDAAKFHSYADMSGYYLLRKGEFAYNKSTSGDSPWGAVKRLVRYEKGCVSTVHLLRARRR